MPYNQDQLDRYVTYSFDGPRLNRDVPANKVQFGQQSRVSGIDGRFSGCLRNFYGFRLTVDLKAVTGLSAITGVSFLQEVVFQKRGTSTTYRGFVIRYNANADTTNEDVGVVYSSDNGSTWTYLGVWTGAATAITATTAMEAAVSGAYLMIAVEGKATKTVYWSGSAVVAVSSGPGDFGVALGALAVASQAEDTSYFLKGTGSYQVRWRFYSSTRGIYSAMSNAVTVYGSGTDTQNQWKVTLNFPNNGAVVSAKVYADFDALFDTIDVFRTIDLGDVPAAQQGAIFYAEQSIVKAGNWATSGTFDSLTVTIGTVPDTALVLLEQYDSSTDSIVAPPQSGAIARYQGMTLMGQASSDDNPYNILASSLTHTSPEYFTTYNEREGNAERGRPTRFLKAGDSCFALHPGGFVHIYKSSAERPVQFIDTINGIGLDGKWAAQLLGNGILMICGGQLRQMGGNDGNIVDLPGLGRLLADDWANDIASYVSGGFDARLNCSMFLDSQRSEILCLWHATGGISLLEGANFAWMTSGPDITDGGRPRVYCVTAGGRVVTPDYAKAGSGTMFDLSASYTLAGSATGGSTTTLTCTGATFHADMVGSRVYMIDGANAGDYAVVESVNVGTATLTFTDATAFAYAVSYGDRFAVSPVPVRITAAPVRPMNAPEPLVSFDRQKMVGLSVKFQSITGLTVGVTDTLRFGVFRNGSTTLETETGEVEVSADIDEATGCFEHAIDGLDILPYLEYIGVGSSFEITDVQVLKPDIDSKAVT